MPNRPTASFNGSDLASVVPGLIIVSTNPYRPPSREVNVMKIASSDISTSPSANYKDRKLNVSVEIGRNTRELLDDSIDALLAILQPRQKLLVLSVGSGTRQWTATYANMGISDVKGGHAVIDIEFIAPDGIGVDVASTNLFSSSLTGATSTTPFIGLMGGTHQWQQPIITITYNSLTMNGDTDTVTIGNPANSQQIEITRAWTAGDVLVIDSRDGYKSVKVNGTEVAFTGSIPEWERNTAGSMDYSDTMTARNRTMSGLYYKRYA